MSWKIHKPYFFNQTPLLLFFSLFTFVWILFESGYYLRAATIRGQRLFLWKPTDINDGLIRCVWVRRWWLLDTVSVHVPCILAMATVWWLCLFCSELLTVRLLFEGADYLRVVPFQRNSVLLKDEIPKMAQITQHAKCPSITVWN